MGLPVTLTLALIAVVTVAVVVVAVTKEEAFGAMGGLPFLFYAFFFLTCLVLNFRVWLCVSRGDFRRKL